MLYILQFYSLFYEHIQLRPNQSLRDLSNVWKDYSAFSFRQVVPDVKAWSDPIPELKKFSLINDWENIIVYLEESEWSKALGNKCGLFQKKLGSLGWHISDASEKFCNFYPHLRLEAVFPALPQSCYIWTFFFLKTSSLIINWLPLSITHTVPERLSSQSNKVWKQMNFKNPNFLTLYWIEKKSVRAA